MLHYFFECSMAVFGLHIYSIVFSISEAFLESIPQTHLTLMLLVLNDEVLVGYDATGTNWDECIPVCGLFDSLLFLLGFTSSMLSASLGMARLLMNGPSRLVKNKGLCQVGFALVMLSIMCILVAKASWLGLSTYSSNRWRVRNDPLYALVWIGISLAPQLILVSLSKCDEKYDVLKP